MTTLEETFEEFRKLPDWDKYPMPEVFYEHFHLKKPKSDASVMEMLTYQAPPSVSLNTDGKVEIRKPAEGGVREILLLEAPPVEVKRLNDETQELEEYPKLEPVKVPTWSMQQDSEEMKHIVDSYKQFTDQIVSDTKKGSVPYWLNLPKEDNTTETQPE